MLMPHGEAVPDPAHTSSEPMFAEPESDQGPVDPVQEVIAGLQDQIEKLNKENAQLKDAALRAMAESQNSARRQRQELENFRKWSNESLVADLIPVLDNFDRTIQAVSKGASVESLAEGVNAIERQLRKVLEQYNVRRIDPVGEKFDPALHEAVVTHETAEHADDTVLEVLEAGYVIHDRLIRPSRVKVSKRP